jgi:hypothetical protein
LAEANGCCPEGVTELVLGGSPWKGEAPTEPPDPIVGGRGSCRAARSRWLGSAGASPSQEAACTEVEEGQSVYELKGQSKTGKMLEVEITKDGKFLE